MYFRPDGVTVQSTLPATWTETIGRNKKSLGLQQTQINCLRAFAERNESTAQVEPLADDVDRTYLRVDGEIVSHEGKRSYRLSNT